MNLFSESLTLESTGIDRSFHGMQARLPDGHYLYRAARLVLHEADGSVAHVEVERGAMPLNRYVCLAEVELRERSGEWREPHLVAWADSGDHVDVVDAAHGRVTFPYLLVEEEELEPTLREFVTNRKEQE